MFHYQKGADFRRALVTGEHVQALCGKWGPSVETDAAATPEPGAAGFCTRCAAIHSALVVPRDVRAMVPAWAENIVLEERTRDGDFYRATTHVAGLEIVAAVDKLPDGTVTVEVPIVDVNIGEITGDTAADVAREVRSLASDLLAVALRLNPAQEVTA